MPARNIALGVAVMMIFALGALAAGVGFTEAMGVGWSEGLACPFSGIHHLVAMVAVGLWATQLAPPRAVWLLPMTFPGFMALGLGLSIAGIAVPGVEDGIAVSVAVLGVLLAVAARPRLALAAAVVALFGLFHGYAQGGEMPETAEPLPYGLGLVLAAGTLHLVGIGLGLIARSPTGQRLLPVGAAAIAGIGIALILAL